MLVCGAFIEKLRLLENSPDETRWICDTNNRSVFAHHQVSATLPAYAGFDLIFNMVNIRCVQIQASTFPSANFTETQSLTQGVKGQERLSSGMSVSLRKICNQTCPDTLP